jgi:twitching motility protein PilT
LLAIVAQQLLPRADGAGRVPALEILIATPAVRDCLKDPTRLPEVKALMTEAQAKSGMQTFQQHLEELASVGTISSETAKAVGGIGERKARSRKGSQE